MFNYTKNEGSVSKCYFTHLKLPVHIDEKKPPTRTIPFSTIHSQPFSHHANLVLPVELYDIVKNELDGDAATLRYSKVFMNLCQILQGDFFTHYIKIGNILMLSEGRPGVDNTFSLRDGILRIELDKATYERCGLQGKAIPSGGRKHVKSRFAIDMNLRLPSMLHGKKGFERLIWACKNVLDQSLTWLFVDLNASADTDEEGPIKEHQPFRYSIKPTETRLITSFNVPVLPPPGVSYDSAAAEDLLEYLSLITLNSPRIYADDSVDPYLSRYRVPDPFPGVEDGAAVEARDLVSLNWKGFASPKFLMKIWMLARKERKEDWWISMTGSQFGGGFYTVLESGEGEGEVLCWQCDA